MDDSLSLVLPVRNAEAILRPLVAELLELLPDLARRFEIIVVDDGSDDHTADVAHDLAAEYPQVNVRELARPGGRDAAVKVGLSAARGRTIFVQEDAAPFSATQLRRLWSLRHDRELVMARTHQRPGVLDPELIDRLMTWGQSLRNLANRSRAGGLQMIRRDGAQELVGPSSRAPNEVLLSVPRV